MRIYRRPQPLLLILGKNALLAQRPNHGPLSGIVVQVFRNRQTWSALLALLGFLGLIAVSFAAVIVGDAERRVTGTGGLFWAAAGAAAAVVLVSFQRHPTRVRGLIPFGAIVLVGAVSWAAWASDRRWPCLLLGSAWGLIGIPLGMEYLGALPANRRGLGLALWSLGSGCLAILVCLLAPALVSTPPGLFAGLIVVALLAAGAAWYAYLRPALEQVMEILLWPIYRVKAHGPGLAEFPAHGPVLIIANHTAWFDPLWLAKVTPREVTPMMTSAFYDLPILRFLMERVVRAIRVPAKPFRREAPELQEGIAVLDRGGCLVIFPEGFVKRRPEQVLHFFAQGVWRILSQRPDTPVVACWIEGGWGSYTSYCGSPPMVRKRMDWWRRINIAMDAPQILSAQLLADQRATRSYLMQACLKARSHLGLQPLAGEPSPEENEEQQEQNE